MCHALVSFAPTRNPPPPPPSRVVKLWKKRLSKVNLKAADSLADPNAYDNLFPGLQQALVAEQYLKEVTVRVRPAADYPLSTVRQTQGLISRLMFDCWPCA